MQDSLQQLTEQHQRENEDVMSAAGNLTHQSLLRVVAKFPSWFVVSFCISRTCVSADSKRQVVELRHIIMRREEEVRHLRERLQQQVFVQQVRVEIELQTTKQGLL